ncbi:hypothetical protein BDV11DRAFT_206595 [Aspergillus similis]
MRPLDDKRATKIQVDQVPLLQQPVHKNYAEGSPKTKLKLTPGPLQASSHLKKGSTMPAHAELIRGPRVWSTLYYECDLAGTVAACVRSSDSRAVRAIHQYLIQKADRIMGILRSISHKNVVSIYELFRTSLFPAYSEQFHYPSFNCSSVLMGLEGEIRIGRLQSSEFSPVSIVVLEMVQKYAKEGTRRTVGIDNPDRWEFRPTATLSLPLSRLACDLIALAWFAMVSARTFYSYAPRSESKTRSSCHCLRTEKESK